MAARRKRVSRPRKANGQFRKRRSAGGVRKGIRRARRLISRLRG